MTANDAHEQVPSGATVEQCRALVARSIDQAILESCVVRDELIDRAMEFDSEASAIEGAVCETSGPPFKKLSDALSTHAGGDYGNPHSKRRLNK